VDRTKKPENPKERQRTKCSWEEEKTRSNAASEREAEKSTRKLGSNKKKKRMLHLGRSGGVESERQFRRRPSLQRDWSPTEGRRSQTQQVNSNADTYRFRKITRYVVVEKSKPNELGRLRALKVTCAGRGKGVRSPTQGDAGTTPSRSSRPRKRKRSEERRKRKTNMKGRERQLLAEKNNLTTTVDRVRK